MIPSLILLAACTGASDPSIPVDTDPVDTDVVDTDVVDTDVADTDVPIDPTALQAALDSWFAADTMGLEGVRLVVHAADDTRVLDLVAATCRPTLGSPWPPPRS